MKERFFQLLLVVLFMGFGLVQCKKNKGPTIRIVTLQPQAEDGKDATIFSARPDQTGESLIVLRADVNDTGLVTTVERGLIEFDLSFISDNAEIMLAELSLYYYDPANEPHHSTTGPNVAFIQRITESWKENTVTWNNQPASTATKQFLIHDTTEPFEDLLDMDVTELITEILANRDQSHGMLIRLEVEEGNKGLYLASSDHTDANLHPKLVLTIRE